MRKKCFGKSWKNLGLKKSEHIGRVAIDPLDSKVVYVAAEGPLWGPGGDRGLYKSVDFGKSWTVVPGSVAVATGRSIAAEHHSCWLPRRASVLAPVGHLMKRARRPVQRPSPWRVQNKSLICSGPVIFEAPVERIGRRPPA